jgi:hypothetical protein
LQRYRAQAGAFEQKIQLKGPLKKPSILLARKEPGKTKTRRTLFSVKKDAFKRPYGAAYSGEALRASFALPPKKFS